MIKMEIEMNIYDINVICYSMLILLCLFLTYTVLKIARKFLWLEFMLFQLSNNLSSVRNVNDFEHKFKRFSLGLKKKNYWCI